MFPIRLMVFVATAAVMLCGVFQELRVAEAGVSSHSIVQTSRTSVSKRGRKQRQKHQHRQRQQSEFRSQELKVDNIATAEVDSIDLKGGDSVSVLDLVSWLVRGPGQFSKLSKRVVKLEHQADDSELKVEFMSKEIEDLRTEWQAYKADVSAKVATLLGKVQSLTDTIEQNPNDTEAINQIKADIVTSRAAFDALIDPSSVAPSGGSTAPQTDGTATV